MQRLRDEQFRILSLDGGGVRGALTTGVLKNIEQYLDKTTGETKPLGQRFDLIVGTSVGGLIGLALALGKSANDVDEFFCSKVTKVFSKENRRFTSLLSAKYFGSTLRAITDEYFRDSTLRDVITDVCVVSISLQNAQPRLYKSDYLGRNFARLDEKLTDIAIATTAAPTYFPAAQLAHSGYLIDGGLCANNPSVIGIVDACQFERASKRGAISPRGLTLNGENTLTMISIGTGNQTMMPFNINQLASGGTAYWAKPFVDFTITSQSHIAHFQSKFLLKHRYLRVNPDLNFPMELDDVTHLKELRNLIDINSDVESFLMNVF